MQCDTVVNTLTHPEEPACIIYEAIDIDENGEGEYVPIDELRTWLPIIEIRDKYCPGAEIKCIDEYLLLECNKHHIEYMIITGDTFIPADFRELIELLGKPEWEPYDGWYAYSKEHVWEKLKSK